MSTILSRCSRRTLSTTKSLQKEVLKNLKGKSKSSQEWLLRQSKDEYLKKAKELGYRARSAFKLIELDDKLKILKPGITVLECGASPGSWTQVVSSRVNSDEKDKKKKIGRVIGVDLLYIEPINGAILLSNSDFTNLEVQEKIKNILLSSSSSDQNEKNENLQSSDVNNKNESEDKLIDLVLSDMAPNASGSKETDHYRIIELVRHALKFAIYNTKLGSHFLAKIWMGSETNKLESDILKFYESCKFIKPLSSRKDSAEIYIFGKNKLK